MSATLCLITPGEAIPEDTDGQGSGTIDTVFTALELASHMIFKLWLHSRERALQTQKNKENVVGMNPFF